MSSNCSGRSVIGLTADTARTYRPARTRARMQDATSENLLESRLRCDRSTAGHALDARGWESGRPSNVLRRVQPHNSRRASFSITFSTRTVLGLTTAPSTLQAAPTENDAQQTLGSASVWERSYRPACRIHPDDRHLLHHEVHRARRRGHRRKLQVVCQRPEPSRSLRHRCCYTAEREAPCTALSSLIPN